MQEERHTIVGSHCEIKEVMPYPVYIEGENITIEFKYGYFFDKHD